MRIELRIVVEQTENWTHISCNNCCKILYGSDPTLPGLGTASYTDALKSIAVNHRCKESMR